MNIKRREGNGKGAPTTRNHYYTTCDRTQWPGLLDSPAEAVTREARQSTHLSGFPCMTVWWDALLYATKLSLPSRPPPHFPNPRHHHYIDRSMLLLVANAPQIHGPPSPKNRAPECFNSFSIYCWC